MVHSPWEANWFAASQEILRISRNPNVHYRTHKRPPPVSILGQPNPVHIPTSHPLEIHPNIIHPSMPRSAQWSLSLRFPHQDPIHQDPITFLSYCTLNLLSLTNAVYLAAGLKVLNPLCAIRGCHSVVDEDTTSRRLLISYRRFGGDYCLKLHDISRSLSPSTFFLKQQF